VVGNSPGKACQHTISKEGPVKIKKKILDYEYEEVLETKYRELIRVGCAIAVGCPT
jgi:alkylhydroperoxidase/carboxymuconolactone decarboxylase family protein YurZ